MNISGIRTHAGFYDYNEIKNGQVRSQQMEQTEPEAEKTLQQTVEVQPESKQSEQTFDSYAYAMQYEPDQEYELKGADSDLALLDVNQVLSDVKKDQILQQYQFFVGESKAQKDGMTDLNPPDMEHFYL